LICETAEELGAKLSRETGMAKFSRSSWVLSSQSKEKYIDIKIAIPGSLRISRS
jgi:hypothetical protein